MRNNAEIHVVLLLQPYLSQTPLRYCLTPVSHQYIPIDFTANSIKVVSHAGELGLFSTEQLQGFSQNHRAFTRSFYNRQQGKGWSQAY